MPGVIWVPSDKVTVTQTHYTDGRSAITVQGDYSAQRVERTTGFGEAKTESIRGEVREDGEHHGWPLREVRDD